MFEKNKIKSSWKLIVTAIGALGATVWGAVLWIGAAAVTNTAITGTAAVVVTAAAFTFSFGDKGGMSGFYKYVKEADSKYESNPKEADQYLDQLVTALDKEIVNIKSNEASTTQATGNTDLKAVIKKYDKSLNNSEVARTALKIFRNGKMTVSSESGKWINQIIAALNENPNQAADLMAQIKLYSKEILGEEVIVKLLKSKIPTGAKDVVARKLMDGWQREFINSGTLTGNKIAFIEELIPELTNGKSIVPLLSLYTQFSEKQNKIGAADKVLYAVMEADPDSIGGVAASTLVVKNLERREDVVSILYNKNLNNKIGANLKKYYLVSLIKKGKTHEAIELLLEGESIDYSEDKKEISKKILRNINRSLALNSKMLNQLEAIDGFTGKDDALCTLIANAFVTEGRNELAAALAFEYLKSKKNLPISNTTKQIIESASDFSDEQINNKSAAYTILAFLKNYAGEASGAKFDYEMAIKNAKDKVFLSQIHSMYGDLLVSLDEDSKGITHFDTSVALNPSSINLRDARRRILKKVEDKTILSKIEINLEKYKQDFENSKTAEEALTHSKKIVRLCLSVNWRENAVGELLSFSNIYPDHHLTPSMLNDAVELLNKYKLENYKDRVRAVKNKLEEEYQGAS